jgi:hypothetical protein
MAFPVPEPEHYNGVFSWDTITLQANIKGVKTDYSPHDPRSWPMISIDTCRLDVDLDRSPPSFVAYTAVSAGIYFKAPEQQRPPYCAVFNHITKPDVFINRYFYKYPFNFTPKGTLRSVVEIPKADFEEWMRFGGKFVQMPLTSEVATPPEKETAPASTYEHIMQSLAEQDADLIVTVPKQALTKAEERFDKLRHKYTMAKSDHELELTNMLTLYIEHKTQKRRADCAEVRVKELEHELEQLKSREQKTSEQMENIWTEMQRVNRKRKMRDNVEGEVAKKKR